MNNTSLPSAFLEKDVDELADKMEYINIDAANYEVTTTRMLPFASFYETVTLQKAINETCIFTHVGFAIENLVWLI